MSSSSPSRKTSARKPSHLGSYSQPSPSGRSAAALASMGSTGGSTGRRMRAHDTPQRAGQRGRAGHDGSVVASRMCLLLPFEAIRTACSTYATTPPPRRSSGAGASWRASTIPTAPAADGEERERLTTRMARINAAYDVLQRPGPPGPLRLHTACPPRALRRGPRAQATARSGPPPPPPSPTGHGSLRHLGLVPGHAIAPPSAAGGRRTPLSGQPPVDWREYRAGPGPAGQCAQRTRPSVGRPRAASVCPASTRRGRRSWASGGSTA